MNKVAAVRYALVSGFQQALQRPEPAGGSLSVALRESFDHFQRIGLGTHPEIVRIWEAVSNRAPFVVWLGKSPLCPEAEGEADAEAYLLEHESMILRSLSSLLGEKPVAIEDLIADFVLFSALPAVGEGAQDAVDIVTSEEHFHVKDDVPQLGIDYLVDWYEILNVPPEIRELARKESLSEEEIQIVDRAITKAYRQRAAAFHPDQQRPGVDESLKKQAERGWKLVEQAYSALEDHQKRQGYHALLDGFDPRLVSKEGIPILAMDRERVSMRYLLSGKPLEAGQAERTAKSLQLTGYDEAAVQRSRRHYQQAAPEDRAGCRADLQAQLERKLIHLDMLSMMAWERSGILNKTDIKGHFQHPDEYQDAVQAELEAFAGVIETEADRQVRRFSAGHTPFLLLPGGGQETPLENDSMRLAEIETEMKRVAVDRFNQGRSDIETLAADRVGVVSELLDLTEWEYVPPGQARLQTVVILLNDGKNILDNMVFQNVEGRMVNLPHLDRFNGTPIETIKDLAGRGAFQAFLDSGRSLVLLKINPTVDVLMQIVRLLEKHFSSEV